LPAHKTENEIPSSRRPIYVYPAQKPVVSESRKHNLFTKSGFALQKKYLTKFIISEEKYFLSN